MSVRLPVPVRRVLRDPVDAAATDAAWQRHALGRYGRSTRATRAWTAGGVLAAAAVLVVVGRMALGPVLDAGPLRLAGGRLPGTLTAAPRATFSDGSAIDLAAGARLETLDNDGRAFTVLLSDGVATFDVRPGGPRRWTIECGLATVRVVGTRFTIERAATRLRVRVARGVVLVTGERVPGGARRLTAGQEIIVVAAPLSAAAAVPPIAQPSSVPQPAEPPTTVAAAPGALRPAPPASRAWRTMAGAGAWNDAYASLGADGIRATARNASTEDLLALADVARLSGHPADAVAPLETILRTHRDDPNASLAAFTLGRVEADGMHRADRASIAFADAIELGLAPALESDALARLASVRLEAGDQAGARAAAARYVRSYPDGRAADAMRAVADGR